MKNSVKAIVAAVALVGFAGQAQSAIRDSAQATGSELVFYALGAPSAGSFVQDLGITFASFIANPGASFSVTMTGLVAAGYTSWGVYAANSTGDLFSTGGYQVLSTVRNNAPVQPAFGNFIAIPGAADAVFGGLDGGSNYGQNLGYTTTGSANTSNWSAALGQDLGANFPTMTDNSFSTTTANFYNFSTAADGADPTFSNFNSAMTWSFNGATLSVNPTNVTAPIPEPGTWAMMLAGLMMVAGIARRRLS